MRLFMVAVLGVTFAYCVWNVWRALRYGEARVAARFGPFGRKRVSLLKKDDLSDGLAYWLAVSMYVFGVLVSGFVLCLVVFGWITGLPG